MYILDFTDSCSMATTDKCNRVVLDGDDAFNYKSLFEVNTIIFRLSHPPNEQIKASMKKFRNEIFFFQQIKRIETAVDCQLFCSQYYCANCTWWLYDETVNYCKVFKGPQEEIYEDCFELGFSSYLFISECQTVLDPVNNDQCHVNFCIFCISCLYV